MTTDPPAWRRRHEDEWEAHHEGHRLVVFAGVGWHAAIDGAVVVGATGRVSWPSRIRAQVGAVVLAGVR